MNAMKRSILLAALLIASAGSAAAQDPGCKNVDQSACDTLGMLINAKGKGCARITKVVPSDDFNRYAVTCELASYDRRLITYVLTFFDGRTRYTVK